MTAGADSRSSSSASRRRALAAAGICGPPHCFSSGGAGDFSFLSLMAKTYPECGSLEQVVTLSFQNLSLGCKLGMPLDRRLRTGGVSSFSTHLPSHMHSTSKVMGGLGKEATGTTLCTSWIIAAGEQEPKCLYSL